MSSMESTRIFIHRETTARYWALYRHIQKWSSNNPIITIGNPTQLDEYNPTSSDFLFILGENAIAKYGEQYRTKCSGASCIFPTSDMAELETSKIYCRQFLECNGLGEYNPSYQVITPDMDYKLLSYENKVIKADGLASGKGVFVFGAHFNTNDDAASIVKKLFKTHTSILVENKLIGEEFSIISFFWNGTTTHFPCIKDFKQRNNGNTGPNTGGMGTISFAGGLMPFLTKHEYRTCCNINETVAKLTNYTGFLYGSFMKTTDGKLKIIEYNVRLGDSEAVNIMELLDSSIIQFMINPVANPLIINRMQYTYFRYLVPLTYPNREPPISGYSSNKLIVSTKISRECWYPANITRIMECNDDIIYEMTESRAGGIFTKALSSLTAININDDYLKGILGNVHYRTDIGEYFNPSKYSQITLSQAGNFNYLGHISNYNDIITSTKQAIDSANTQCELQNPTIKVIGKIGDFANSIQYTMPTVSTNVKIICSVDGAGTKTKFLEGHPHRFRILGQDIVIHNMNDMYCNNGTPIALLDYYGCDKLNKTEFDKFIEGALSVCREYGIALIGGETAEMRSIFASGEVEVLGILLGIVNGLPDNGNHITKGAYIYALSSNGAHTNGFTKLRAIESEHGMPSNTKEFFSQPHTNYVPIMQEITRILYEDLQLEIVGKAHITGGGFHDNIERILPDSSMKIELIKWDLDQHWDWLYRNAGMEWSQFIRVFNAGWGFCFITNSEISKIVLDKINNITKENIKMIGRIV